MCSETLAEVLAEHAVNVELRDPAEIYQLADGLDPDGARHRAGDLGVPAERRQSARPPASLRHRERRDPAVPNHRVPVARGDRIPDRSAGSADPVSRRDAIPGHAAVARMPGHSRTYHDESDGRVRFSTGGARLGASAGRDCSLAGAAAVSGSDDACPGEMDHGGRRHPVRTRCRGKARRLDFARSQPALAPVAAPAREVSATPAPPPAGPAASSSAEPSLPAPQTQPQPQPLELKPELPSQMPQAQESPAQAAVPQAEDAGQQRVVEATTPLGQTHILVLFRAGSVKGEAQARQIAASLGGRVASAEIRPASNLPRVPRIRYFGREDKTAARDLNGMLNSSTSKLWVRYQAVRPPDAQPGTIEIRLPQQLGTNHSSSRPTHHQR